MKSNKEEERREKKKNEKEKKWKRLFTLSVPLKTSMKSLQDRLPFCVDPPEHFNKKFMITIFSQNFDGSLHSSICVCMYT